MNKVFLAPIRIKLPTVFGMKSVNSWLLKGEENILIDCGEDTLECRAALTIGLKEHGLEISNIDRVVISHAHVDHIGMASWLATEHDISIWVSELVFPWAVDTEHCWQEREHYLGNQISHYLGEEGRQLFFHSYIDMMDKVMAVWRAVPREMVHVFSSEGPINFGTQTWQVLHLPGHAATQSGFYQAQNQWFISSDALLRLTPTPVIEPRKDGCDYRFPIVEMMNSLKRIKSLPIKHVYPGHYRAFDDPDLKIEEQIGRIEQRTFECHQLILGGNLQAVDLYRQMYPGKFYLPAFNMVLAYLDLLTERKQVTRVVENGQVYFKKIGH